VARACLAAPATHAGLWVGEVVINDVSQARLGATDETELTVQMSAMNSSGVKGSADLTEVGGTTVRIAMELSLPTVSVETVAEPTVTAPYVYGRVFVDTNQNGQADRTEPGLAGVEVVFAPGGTATTQADGKYWLSSISEAIHGVTIDDPSGKLAGYTNQFLVTVPVAKVEATPVVPTPVANAWPTSVTIDSLGANDAAPQAYLDQVLPPPHDLPLWDENGKRVQPPLNFGYVREDEAGVYAGPCTAPRERLYPDLGDDEDNPLPGWPVKNGILTQDLSSSLGNLIGTNTTNNLSVLRGGVVIACGDIVVGAPTAFSDGRGSQAKLRILLRVDGSDDVELLPYYQMDDTERISAVNFLSLQGAELATGKFGSEGQAIQFDWTLPGNDPLNPFKHKYHPDHDNLDRAFAPIPNSILYESYDVERRITLTLRDFSGDAETARSLDWGGTTWGGEYREVLDGLHKNPITVHGFFTIRQMITGQLRPQDYDAPAPAAVSNGQ
jgi:hypothetical protein